MSCCSLGVNAFRSSVQIAVQHLSRPCGRLRPTAVAPAARCFSIWPPSSQQQRRQRCSRSPAVRPWAPLCASKTHVSLPAHVRALKTSQQAVIIRYVDIPPTYTDEAGLPFRRNDLEPVEVVKLFGSNMSTQAANRLLRILHGRRVAGTLEDPTLQVNLAMYSKKEKKIALDYLRKTVQVDEITNAGLRAEDELAALEGDGEEGGDTSKTSTWLGNRFSPYKQAAEDRSVYQQGAFDAIRAKNKAKWEEKLRQQEEEARRKKEEEEAAIQSGELEVAGERRLGLAREPSPQMQKWLDKAQSDLEEPPEMPKWQRILPSTVVVGGFVCLLVAYAAYYRPLKRSDRLWPEIPPAAATVGVLMLANLAIYAAWKMPPLWRTLNQYFLLVPATPRVLSIFGAGFSHQKFSHLLANMFILWLVGTKLHDDIGRGNFLAIYLGSSAVGFLGSLTHLVMMNKLHFTTLGASGGVYGVMGAYFWMHRFEGFKLFDLPPEPFNGVPGMAFLGLLVGINIATMLSTHHTIDVASHLVAMGAGIIASRTVEARREAKRRAQEKTELDAVPARTAEK